MAESPFCEPVSLNSRLDWVPAGNVKRPMPERAVSVSSVFTAEAPVPVVTA